MEGDGREVKMEEEGEGKSEKAGAIKSAWKRGKVRGGGAEGKREEWGKGKERERKEKRGKRDREERGEEKG